eukprot:Plantae.Rhodophyta-Rhodochaete_pulchella.ctg9868.p2 GENE.Plantae.Rhodophyta-Rhodochaete_pulchella.ctg9868~~Plantae.Rhodophyta-Rhodochaete_pulchella.ctg9868.p2  ORF type:complete len:112 (-),score=7.95 Plantae.Rhodophyta-Rhodochaete_pulchella.ctg9868:1120-1455(-)
MAFLATFQHLWGAAGLINRSEDSGMPIGKRCSRADEVLTPFGITDFQSVEDGSVALGERDSLEQIRGTAEDTVTAVDSLCNGREGWSDMTARLHRYDSRCNEEINRRRHEL